METVEITVRVERATSPLVALAKVREKAHLYGVRPRMTYAEIRSCEYTGNAWDCEATFEIGAAK